MFCQSGGRIRHVNAVNPLPGKRSDPAETMLEAEQFYRSHGQPPLFRVATIAGEMEPVLEASGYLPEGETLVLCGDLAGGARQPPGPAVLTATGSDDWLACRAAFGSDSTGEESAYRLIGRPTLFGLYHNTNVTNRDYVALYVSRDFEETRRFAPNIEIAEFGWFPWKEIPADAAPSTRRRLAEIFEGAEKGERW